MTTTAMDEYGTPFVATTGLAVDTLSDQYTPAWQESPATAVQAGRRTVPQLAMLKGHGGNPQLLVAWNDMPAGTSQVDVVVHFHGYSGHRQRLTLQHKVPISGLDLVAPDGSARRTRPTVTLLPRGRYFGGNSGIGFDFPALVQPGALDKLIAEGLSSFQAATGLAVSRSRLIVTGHSGGGAPIQRILKHTDPDEVHVFDGTYGDASPLIAWAKRRIARGSTASAMTVLYVPGTGTAGQALRVGRELCSALSGADPALRSRFRVEGTRTSHNDIPKVFGWRLLADPAAPLPGATRYGCRGTRTGEHEDFAANDELEDSVNRSYEELEEDLAWDPGLEAEDEFAGEDEEQFWPFSSPTGSPPAPATPGKDRARGVVTYSKPTSKDARKAQPGATKLAQMWKRISGIKAGTYNYRLTTFGTRSAHGEGRAIDCYARVSVPGQKALADAYVQWLQDNAVELQVAVIIWNKRIWGWHKRTQGWRPYRGNPHTDHIHIELSWEGALQPSPLLDTTPFRLTPLGTVVWAVGQGIGAAVAGVRGAFEDEDLYNIDNFDNFDSEDFDSLDTEQLDTESFDTEGFDTEGFDSEDFDTEDFESFEPEEFEPEDFAAEDFEPEGFDTEEFEPEGFSFEDSDPEGFEPEDFDTFDTEEEVSDGRWSAEATPEFEDESDRQKGVVRRGVFRACTGKAQPGAKALAAQWTRWTGRKAEVYNCRPTVFGSPSLHGEGRAIDCYARADNQAQRQQAETYIAWLLANAVELQVSVVIWNRKIWAWHKRAQGWRPYNGNPHTDHIHVELSWEGANTPSALFQTSPSGAAPAPTPTPTPGPTPAPPSGVKLKPADFVRQYAALAADNLATHGVPVLVTLGQAALESGWGARAAGYNFFGIKAKASDPPASRQLWRTREVMKTPNAKFPEVISVTPRADGRYDYVVRDWFRAYPSAREAFLGHGAFLRRNKRYAAAFQTTEPFAFASAVAKAGYATGPTYESTLHSVMRTLQRAGAK